MSENVPSVPEFRPEFRRALPSALILHESIAPAHLFLWIAVRLRSRIGEVVAVIFFMLGFWVLTF